jgi:transcription initiation factor TFIIB
MIAPDCSCPECHCTNINQDYNRGELVCNDCGLILSENQIDPGAEWRAFDMAQQEQRSRTGAPMNIMMHDKGLNTDIGYGNYDSYGTPINNRMRSQIRRLRKWQYRIRASNSSERNLIRGLKELSRMASLMGLPKNVKEEAAMIYREAVRKKLIIGRSTDSIVSASLYASCRQCGNPRTLEEVAAASVLGTTRDGGRKEVAKSYRVVVRALGLGLKTPTPYDYVSRFCSQLELPEHVIQETVRILEEASKGQMVVGKSPVSITAAAIYIAAKQCNKKRKQREIAKVAGITEVTIRNRYKEILALMDYNT